MVTLPRQQGRCSAPSTSSAASVGVSIGQEDYSCGGKNPPRHPGEVPSGCRDKHEQENNGQGNHGSLRDRRDIPPGSEMPSSLAEKIIGALLRKSKHGDNALSVCAQLIGAHLEGIAKHDGSGSCGGHRRSTEGSRAHATRRGVPAQTTPLRDRDDREQSAASQHARIHRDRRSRRRRSSGSFQARAALAQHPIALGTGRRHSGRHQNPRRPAPRMRGAAKRCHSALLRVQISVCVPSSPSSRRA